MSSDSPRTSPDERQPVTAAGRRLLRWRHEQISDIGLSDDRVAELDADFAESVRRIEAEASPAASGDALREAWRQHHADPDWHRSDETSGCDGECMPDIANRLAASPPLPEGLDPTNWTRTWNGAGSGWMHVHPDGTRWVHPEKKCALQQPASREGA